MATQTIYLTGIAKWARVYESQMDRKYGEKFHITLYPDDASQIILKSSGSRVQKNEDEDGVYFKFSRDNKKEFKGEIEVLGPPKVVSLDGEQMNKLIGNGSKVTVKLTVYDSKFGKGTRLEAVRVDDLIEYSDGSSGDEPF